MTLSFCPIQQKLVHLHSVQRTNKNILPYFLMNRGIKVWEESTREPATGARCEKRPSCQPAFSTVFSRSWCVVTGCVWRLEVWLPRVCLLGGRGRVYIRLADSSRRSAGNIGGDRYRATPPRVKHGLACNCAVIFGTSGRVGVAVKWSTGKRECSHPHSSSSMFGERRAKHSSEAWLKTHIHALTRPFFLRTEGVDEIDDFSSN